jgi:hypothetical protein
MRAACVSGDTLPPWSKNNQVGMIQAKGLCDVAVPTDRQMCLKHIPQIVEQNFLPSHQLSGRIL